MLLGSLSFKNSPMTEPFGPCPSQTAAKVKRSSSKKFSS